MWRLNKKNHNQKSLSWIFNKYWYNFILYYNEFFFIKTFKKVKIKTVKFYTSFNNKLSSKFYYNRKNYNSIKALNNFNFTNKTALFFIKEFMIMNKLKNKNKLLLTSYFLV